MFLQTDSLVKQKANSLVKTLGLKQFPWFADYFGLGAYLYDNRFFVRTELLSVMLGLEIDRITFNLPNVDHFADTPRGKSQLNKRTSTAI